MFHVAETWEEEALSMLRESRCVSFTRSRPGVTDGGNAGSAANGSVCEWKQQHRRKVGVKPNPNKAQTGAFWENLFRTDIYKKKKKICFREERKLNMACDPNRRRETGRCPVSTETDLYMSRRNAAQTLRHEAGEGHDRVDVSSGI